MKYWKTSLVLFLFFFALVLVTGYSQSINLLNNGGFENGQTAWNGWNSGITLSSDNPYEGNQCARFTVRSSIDQSIITLEPGKTYKMSVRIRINAMSGNDWGGIRFSVISYNWSEWHNSEAFSPQNRPVGIWFQEIIEFQPTQTQYRAQIGFFGGSGWNVDFSYDDIQLYEQIAQNAPPVIQSVAVTPLSGVVPFTITGQITATDSDGVIQNYVVDTGDGAVYSGSSSFQHTYRVPGNYSLSVTVVDDNAATDRLSTSIQAISANNHVLQIDSPTASPGIDYYLTNQSSVLISGIRQNGSGDIFWINTKTGQSGTVTVSNNLFQIPAVQLSPGLNVIEVQSAYGDGTHLTDNSRIYYLPQNYSGPLVNNISATKTQAKQYERINITFDIVTIAENPYFPFDENKPENLHTGSGITVDMEFTNGSIVKRQPSFYHMEVSRSGNILIPSGDYQWTVRMAFKEPGIWTSRILARDSAGLTQVTGPTFTIMTDSLAKGYVSVSVSDNRYFQYDDGSVFFGMGHGTSVSGPDNVDAELQQWRQNKLNFGRFWLSSSSPFSDSWSSWATHHLMENNGYMPPPLLSTQQKYGSGQFSWRIASPAVENQNTPAIFRGFWDGSIPVRPNTSYKLTARVKTINVQGTGGLVFKIGGWLGTEVINAGVGTAVTPYMKGDNGWSYLFGTIQTAANQTTLDYLYMVLENCTGEAFLDQLTIQEINPDGSLKANILSKWNANTHHYLDPIKSREADYMIDAAHNHNIHYKVVIHEKNDFISNRIDQAGFVSNTQGNFEQASGTPLRRLYEYYWRHLVARWGYATSIHSWELVNEGAPGSYFELTNALSGYFSTQSPYPRMASTSFWSSWVPSYWRDSEASYADIHAYVMTTGWIDTITIEGVFYDREALKNDAAAAVYAYSVRVGTDPDRNKPVILGETDLDMPGDQSPDPLLATDTAGVWLHNFNWAHINHGGLQSLIWNSDNIRNNQLYHRYRGFQYFMKNIPLHTGQYQNAAAQSSNPNLRVWGQRQSSGNAAHIWVQNRNHTWKNVLLNGVPPPESGTISITGLTPGPMILERWNSWAEDTLAYQIDTIIINSTGTYQLNIENLSRDIAFKFFNENVVLTVSDDWRQYQRDSGRTGRTQVSVAPPYRARWIWCHDNVILRNQLSESGWTHDLTSRNGYSFPLPDTAFVTIDQGVQPAVVGNRLYFGTMEGKVYALNLFDGTTLWSADLAGGTVVSPAVTDNKVIFAGIRGIVMALDTLSGAVLWSFNTKGAITSDPLVVSGSVIIANHRGKIFRFDPNGTLLWQQNVVYPIVGGIAADNLSVYVPAENMKVYKLHLSDGSIIAERQVRGQSFRQTHPVLSNGRLWVTSCPAPMVGSEYILDDVLDDGNNLSEEEANIRLWLQGNDNNGQWSYASQDWQNIFALDAQTLESSFLIGAGPVDGVGSPAPPVVVDNENRVLRWFKTAFAWLTGAGPAFGTRHTIDISAIDPNNGNRIPIDNGQTAGMWLLETDNTYGLSVGGDYLWLRQRFRGVQNIHLHTSQWQMVQVPIRNHDGGSFTQAHVAYTDILPNNHYLQTPVVLKQQPFSKRTAPVIAKKYIVLAESFGIVVLESYQP